MGVIRKTMSIGTLGLVNFRSKKEKLARAEAAFDAEHIARQVAESSISKVEAELRRLTGAEQKAAKQLAKLRRSRKVRKAETLSTLLAGAAPAVKDGVQSARHTVSDMSDKGRKRGRKARKAARAAAHKASHDIRVGAEKVLGEARAALAES